MSIRIKEPCMENWHEMPVVAGGKFCSACKHHVHDLTGLSGDEIKKLHALNDGKICGRVSVNLLREQMMRSTVRSDYFYRLRIFCCAVVLSFGANLFTLPAANARGMVATVKSRLLKIASDTNKTDVVIKGVVKDKKTGEQLPFANVLVLSKDSVVIADTLTNIDGEYELRIDPAKYTHVNMEVAYVGYDKMRMTQIDVKGKIKTITVDFLLSGGGDLEMMGMIEYGPPNTPMIIDEFQSGQRVYRDDYRRRPK